MNIRNLLAASLMATGSFGLPVIQGAVIQQEQQANAAAQGLAMVLSQSGKDGPVSSQAPVATIRTPQYMGNADDFNMPLMLSLVNNMRTAHGVAPVSYHNALMKLAQEHAVYQSTNHMVTHADKDGSLGDRVNRLGLEWSLIAENVGAGAANEEGIVAAWAQSPPHMANVIHPDVRYMGVGVSHGYWVQDFVAPRQW